MDNTIYKRQMIPSSGVMPVSKGVSKTTKLDTTMSCYLTLLAGLPKGAASNANAQSHNKINGQSHADGMAQANLSDFIR